MAMMLMLQKQEPSDYAIATGESCSLAEFIAEAFDAVGLNWQDFVRVDPNLMRPTDLAVGLGNPNKAKLQLGWEAKYRAKDVVKMMVKANLEGS
jgi:GDPmannose 4,6-dehydratase